MRLRKLRRYLERGFGKPPDPHYFHGDMEYIRAYADFRRDAGRDAFHVDDLTWDDLDLDGVYRRINSSLSTSGEQVLYHMLRAPAVSEAEYKSRAGLTALMGEDSALRLKLQVLLARLGCTRRSDLCRAFQPSAHGIGWLIVYLLLLSLVPASIVVASLVPNAGILIVLGVLFVNSMLHEIRIRATRRDFDTVNYAVAMALTLRKMRKIGSAALDAHLAPAYRSLDRLRGALRMGGISTEFYDPMAESAMTMLLLDLIAYEFLKNKLGRCHDDVFAIHEHLGKIDAAISIASYRKSLPAYALPAIDFAAQTAHLEAPHMAHPLIANPVPNDLVTRAPLLVTGSNASGKSTYLKTALLCAIMAQGVCTCLAASYRASAFRVYSSMAVRDDLPGGESTYVAEVKSLRRILDAAGGAGFVLCAIDEVLRGTNTVDRIAASSVFLSALAARGVICLAATHDIELCALLRGAYRMFHFAETVAEDEMLFDYRLREGVSRSRNALHLLKLLGFDDAIVERAHARAGRYLDEGVWK